MIDLERRSGAVRSRNIRLLGSSNAVYEVRSSGSSVTSSLELLLPLMDGGTAEKIINITQLEGKTRRIRSKVRYKIGGHPLVLHSVQKIWQRARSTPYVCLREHFFIGDISIYRPHLYDIPWTTKGPGQVSCDSWSTYFKRSGYHDSYTKYEVQTIQLHVVGKVISLRCWG